HYLVPGCQTGYVNASRKGGIVMLRDKYVLPVVRGEADLLRRLVSEELDRMCQAVDEIIQRVYEVVPMKHTEEAIAEVKAAVLELVRSPLADLEKKLACVEVEPEPEPEPEPEIKPGPEPEIKPEPEPEPAKPKA
ncbi:unnamed protein product, partial [marine sediment metagenome]